LKTCNVEFFRLIVPEIFPLKRSSLVERLPFFYKLNRFLGAAITGKYSNRTDKKAFPLQDERLDHFI